MDDNGTMSVDDIDKVDAAYIPFMVMYRELSAFTDHNLLIFAEDVSKVAFIANGFLRSAGIEFVILNIALMNIQYTLVQKDESCPSEPDELDDPIRQLLQRKRR